MNKNCPLCDYTCFYCDANGTCMMDSPEKECDDYIYFSEKQDKSDEIDFFFFLME